MRVKQAITINCPQKCIFLSSIYSYLVLSCTNHLWILILDTYVTYMYLEFMLSILQTSCHSEIQVTLLLSVITVFSKHIILLCIIFVLPLSMSESPWSQQEFSWSKEGEKKEKKNCSFHCWWLTLCSKPNLYSPKADKNENHLPLIAHPVIIKLSL